MCTATTDSERIARSRIGTGFNKRNLAVKQMRVSLGDGIGSRILKIGFSLALAKKLGREPVFCWYQNWQCGNNTQMADFFENDLNSVAVSSEMENSSKVALKNTFGKRMIMVGERTPERLSLVELDKYDLIYLGNPALEKAGGLAELRELRQLAASEVRALKLTKKVSEEIDQFAEKMFKGRVLGVHVRGGDIRNYAEKNEALHENKTKQAVRYVPVERFVAKLKEVKDDYDTIFLSVEDEDQLEVIRKAFQDNIVYRSKPHGRESIEHIQEALIEIYLLSKCDFLLLGKSKFGRLAVNLGEVPFETVA